MLLHLVNILWAADNLDLAAHELQKSPGAKFSAISIRYPRELIKQLVMLLLESKDFGTICNKIEEERGWNTPPDPVEVVERGSTPFIPTEPPPEYEDDEEAARQQQIAADHAFALTMIGVSTPTPSQQSDDLDPIVPIPELTLAWGYSPSDDYYKHELMHTRAVSPSDDLYTPDPDYVRTLQIPEEPLSSPEQTPSQCLLHSLRLPSEQKANIAKTVLSFDLPLSKVHGRCISANEDISDMQEAINHAQMEASQTTQKYRSNFVCHTCKIYSHKQKHCDRYFCQICGKFAPCHLNAFCSKLWGRKILCRGHSDPDFYRQLNKLETTYDQAATCEEQECELNALDALTMLKDIDIDPCYYNNMDD
ncbi:hypothetical protein BDR05DRAFT_998893 [Suillus weaverae]|nr:hypothetical protein BDR05DRAFT_998893 [Suillus weaverae]